MSEEQSAADIEGGIALWERERQAMAAAVDRHLALLRAAPTAQAASSATSLGARPRQLTQAALSSAPDAVATALEAQRAKLTESWPAKIWPLRVRIALQADDDAPRDGDYLAAPSSRRG